MKQHQALLINSHSFLALRNAAALTATVLTLSHRGREGKGWLSDVWHLSTYHPPPVCPGSGRDLESVTRCKGICVSCPVHLGRISHGHMHGFCSESSRVIYYPTSPVITAVFEPNIRLLFFLLLQRPSSPTGVCCSHQDPGALFLYTIYIYKTHFSETTAEQWMNSCNNYCYLSILSGESFNILGFWSIQTQRNKMWKTKLV